LKALKEIGFDKALKYAAGEVACLLLRMTVFPPLRVALLRLLGAEIGQDTIVHNVRFINVYRGSFANLHIGKDCFIGEDCLLDLAGVIRIGDQCTLAQRVNVMTHMNVGYADHPLQAYYPSRVAAVEIADGSFVGVASTVLCGIRIGRQCLVAAGSVVTDSIADGTLAAGVPARVVREAHRPEAPVAET